MAKLTPMQAEYMKQVKRLRRAIQREYRQTGVELDKGLIPEMPKRVTQKALKDIKSIKPKDLRRESTYYDPEDLDRPISYEEAKRIWNEEQRNVEVVPTVHMEAVSIQNFQSSLEGYNTGFQAHMTSWLRKLIQEHGVDAVGQMLQAGAEAGVIVTNIIAYDEAKRAEYMAQMLNYLPMTTEDKAEAMEEQENVPDID